LAIGRIADNDSLRLNYAVSVAYETGRCMRYAAGVYFPTTGSLANKAMPSATSCPNRRLSPRGISGSERQTFTDVGAVEQNPFRRHRRLSLLREQAEELSAVPALQVQNILGLDNEQYVVTAAPARSRYCAGKPDLDPPYRERTA
jgi:hypothetical protein